MKFLGTSNAQTFKIEDKKIAVRWTELQTQSVTE